MKRLSPRESLLVKKTLIRKQKGLCPLCLRDITKFLPRNQCLDHDHKTGVIRAVLCRNCNGVEGRIKNRAISCSSGSTYKDWIERLYRYYEKHKLPQTNFLHPTFRTAKELLQRRNKRARDARLKKKGG